MKNEAKNPEYKPSGKARGVKIIKIQEDNNIISKIL